MRTPKSTTKYPKFPELRNVRQKLMGTAKTHRKPTTSTYGTTPTSTTMDTKGENIARPESRSQAETHALVVPVSRKRAEGHNVRLWVRQKLSAKTTASTYMRTPKSTTKHPKFPELRNVRQKLMGTAKTHRKNNSFNLQLTPKSTRSTHCVRSGRPGHSGRSTTTKTQNRLCRISRNVQCGMYPSNPSETSGQCDGVGSREGASPSLAVF
jgi:hypothetical protein